MSGFDVESALTGLAALMTTIPDLQLTNIGAPESLAAQVEGWVTVGDLEEVAPRTAGGPYEMHISLICWFGFSVSSAEDQAEWKLGRYISELTRRLIQNRMRTVDGVGVNLNGAVSRMGLPRAAASPADYAMMAGQESRTYATAVTVTFSETVA